MAGKSTFMRQLAIISYLAQSGVYVPADEVYLPIFSGIHTRIGARDELSKGRSTFMVEMSEMSDILKSCDENGLLILDEIGRGTSTYDGMSLAQAIAEYIVTEIKPMTFFATHYHELGTMEKKFPAIKNYHMKVIEKDGVLQFQHELAEGLAKKSYGLIVAKLAGLPLRVIDLAQRNLKSLESAEHINSPQMSFIPQTFVDEPGRPEYLDFKREISTLDINKLTPLDALLRLSELKNRLEN